MQNYVTEYPGTIQLQNDPRQYKLTLNDNQERILITETNASLEKLQQVFRNEKFDETSVEYKKPHQIGNGFLKNLSDDWDMHVRFMQMHQGLIAIDGEVETSRKWVEHNTEDNWISIIYEITNILKKYQIQFSIWHKKMKRYVTNIVEQMKIQMTPLGKIQWKHVAIAAGITAAVGLTLWGIKKYFDSKED
ncbi:MAG: hypothetical protein NPMRTH1_760013 [Nitrosopumilales archaeon]|nr:MAG: hypothetical protein NPMRTH1_760013 [Nitrosopumilales archaeon]